MSPRGILYSRGVLSCILGAALLFVPSSFYRIDRTCSQEPALWGHLLACFVYLCALALLTHGWVKVSQSANDVPLRRVLLLALLVHGVAMLSLPFLSGDPLFYLAIGRVRAEGGDAHFALSRTLPKGDELLVLLPPSWQQGTTPYGPLWNSLCELMARAASGALLPALRLFQLTSLLSILVSGLLLGRIAGNRAAALLLYCPLAILEGTVGGHNDSLLALCVAGFVVAKLRSQAKLKAAFSPLALLPGVLIKLSAGLLLAFVLLEQSLGWLKQRRPRWLLPVTVSILVGGAVLTGVVLWANPSLRRQLLGDPYGSVYHCTRALECLPRAALHFVLSAKVASFGLGLFVRLLGAGFLCYAAYRGANEGAPLRFAAVFLFGYYLFLHGYMQSWYLLSLLPLLSFLPEPLFVAARVYCVTALAYYVFYLPVACHLSADVPVLVAVSEIAQASVAVLIPIGVLIRLRKQGWV